MAAMSRLRPDARYCGSPRYSPCPSIGVDCISQGVPGLSLVQSGLAGAAQFGLFQPVECEQRPFDATEFAKGKIELVLPTIGGKLAQYD